MFTELFTVVYVDINTSLVSLEQSGNTKGILNDMKEVYGAEENRILETEASHAIQEQAHNGAMDGRSRRMSHFTKERIKTKEVLQ